MRAFAIDDFDAPGEIQELPNPEPAADEVVVRVQRASINAFDAFAAKGSTRAWADTRTPFVPGLDAAGTIESVGKDGTGFKPGDAVIANAGKKGYWGGGVFAELVAVPVTSVVHKPESMGFSEGSTIPTAGLTALSSVDALEPRAGQVVAVIGATGGVGSWFTQLAVARGANVVALVRPDNAEYARSLGASGTVDYASGDVATKLREQFPDGVDGLADFSGDAALIESASAALKRGGRIATPAARLDVDAYTARGLEAKQANQLPFDRMPELLELVASGRVTTPEIAEIPFEQTGEALAAAAAKHGRGKVVIRVA